jgi:hypothetical protein
MSDYRNHSYYPIHELFLPQYNVCLNTEGVSNVFVSATRYDDAVMQKSAEKYNRVENWTPTQVISTLEIKSDTKLHAQLCDLVKSFVEFHVQKSKISQFFNAMEV